VGRISGVGDSPAISASSIRAISRPSDWIGWLTVLNGGSVCRDADLSAGAPSDDFDGVARSAPDIGAFEH